MAMIVNQMPSSGIDNSTRRLLPVRYALKENERGFFVTCVDAPNIQVHVDRGFNASLAAARKYPECTIFLDGAVNGEPFMDVQRRIYNLDHHEGCVRAFTIATCEQAAVIVLKGLDLDGEQWTVFANEPDLDAVLAIWVLLNHMRLMADDSKVRARVMPIVRLQGVIDAHGFELLELSGLSEAAIRTVKEFIETLRAEEVQLKKAGEWEKIDPLKYTISALQSIDDLVYTPDDFRTQVHVDEMVRTPITSDKIAIACESELGIYELEQHLKSIHKDRLGLLILQKARSVFTIRQVDSFLPSTLEPVYDRLNQLDSATGVDRRWSGSSDIGGSPRGVGSKLDSGQIVDACVWVYRPIESLRRIIMIAGAAVLPAVVCWLLLLIANRGLPLGGLPGQMKGCGAAGYGGFSILLTAVSLGAFLVLARRIPGQFGLRSPSGWIWLVAIPVIPLIAIGGGLWLPLWMCAGGTDFGWPFLVVLTLGIVGAELLFRGVVHGVLTAEFNVQYPGGRRFLSIPNVVSSLAYTLSICVLFAPPWWMVADGASLISLVVWAVSALSMGVVCGFAREQGGSIVLPIAVHVVFAIIAWLLAPIIS